VQAFCRRTTAHRRSDGDSHADRSRSCARGGDNWIIGYDFANFLSAACPRSQVATGQDEQEFFSSVAPDDIVRSQIRLQTRRDFFEHSISGGVTELIIDDFEVVNVGQYHRRALAFSLAARELTLQGRNNFRTVQQAGKEVVSGGKPE